MAKVNEAKLKRIQKAVAQALLDEGVDTAKDMRSVLTKVKTRLDVLSVAGHKAYRARG